MTKKALADAAGFGTRTITAYESTRGEIEASPEATKRLADALEFPVSFFDGDDLPEPQIDSASFRSLSRMTARQRDSALASGALGFYLSDWIEAHFRLPAPDIPDMENLDPETAADLVRSAWGLGAYPIENMIHLLESRGVFVFSFDCEKAVDAFSTWKDDRPFVFLGAKKTAERTRMDAAHELAHLTMHRHESKNRRDVEQDAKEFASAFLMPRGDLLARARRSPSTSTVIEDKVRWGVSALAYVVRLYKLRLITEAHYRRLCMLLSAFGYRSDEPNPISHEGSELLRQVFSALWAEGVTRVGIAKQLSLNIADLDSLVFGLLESADRNDDESETAYGVRLRLVKK